VKSLRISVLYFICHIESFLDHRREKSHLKALNLTHYVTGDYPSQQKITPADGLNVSVQSAHLVPRSPSLVEDPGIHQMDHSDGG
jgi:hypothetical protein